tara:strand:+ start:456 stop:2261 length:1806 start_codon:yes stop_codon:yes gene_type:complete
LALEYLTGGETVTAAKLNELWAEVELIAGKALDNKSSLLVFDYTDREIFGQPFFFFNSSNHGVDDFTTFNGAIGGGTVTVSTHDQNAKDAAANAASITELGLDPTKFWAKTSASLNLAASLKAHTRIVSGDKYFLWPDESPHPEKIWNTAVAEIVIGDHDGQFLFNVAWDKFNCFRVHNLTMSSVNVIFGNADDPTHSFTLEANSQRCVRRESVSSGYDSTHRYVWKVKAGDPRFLKFTSHAGSVAQTMEANNVSNPSWLYKFFDLLEDNQLISLDRDTFTDVGPEYQAAGYLPEITDDTIVADLVYHRGALSLTQNEATSTLDFEGFETLPAKFTAAGYATDATGSRFQINRDTSSIVSTIESTGTNLTTLEDDRRVMDMAVANQTLETELALPAFPSGSTSVSGFRRINAGYHFGDTYAGHSTNLGELKIAIRDKMPLIENTSRNQLDEVSAINVKSTTEGPVAYWVESWFTGPFDPGVSIGAFSDSYYSGNFGDDSRWRNNANPVVLLPLDAQINSSGRVEFTQANHLNKIAKYDLTGISFAGWPTDYLNDSTKRYDRIFEGPRFPRRFGHKAIEASASPESDVNDTTQSGYSRLIHR